MNDNNPILNDDIDNPPAEPFDYWAVVEVMGHQRHAGRVTPQMIGSATFIRIDVPATGGKEAYTKMYAPSAIFSITPVTEAVALNAAHDNSRPITTLHYPVQGQIPFEDEEDDCLP